MAASHAAVAWPVVRLVVGADAPPLPVVTEELALGWGHAGRHAKTVAALPPGPPGRGGRPRAARRARRRPVAGVAGAADPGGGDALGGVVPATRCATGPGSQALDARLPKTRAKQRGRRRGLAPPARPLPHHPAAPGSARPGALPGRCAAGRVPAEGATAWDTCRNQAVTATTRGGSVSPAMHARVSGTSPRPSLTDLLVENSYRAHPRCLLGYSLVAPHLIEKIRLCEPVEIHGVYWR